MNTFKWGNVSFKADPKLVWNDLQKIGNEYTPHDVLKYAEENPESELHKCFTWDDSEAAYKWRVQQARWVCNSITVITHTEDKPMTARRIIQNDRTDKVYRPVIFTLQNEDQYARLLAQARNELRGFEKRYSEIVELAAVIEEIRKVL